MTPNLRPFLGATILALAAGAAFWIPAASAARGYFPAPLDDVYIHFDFARSLAQGHPFEWMPGNGYSSGETSPLYALVLAAGWLVGFRGRLMGVWAALVAVLAIASFLRSVQALARPCPPVVAWATAALTLSIGILDWTLFSGMEVAAFAAALGFTLEALARTRARIDERGGLTREASQWRLGAWGAALVLLRPEAGVLVAIFAVTAARGAARRSGVLALVRAALPGAMATALVLGANHVATGEAQSAGAQLKLLSSNPFLSDVDRARAFVENIVTFALKGLRAELSSVRFLGGLLPALALAALLPRARRPVAAACLLGALAYALVVSLNNNAPHHNFRYYAPALLLVLVAAASGAAALAQALGPKRGAALAGAVVTAATLTFALRVPEQVKHFRRSVANIRDQQIEIATRLAARLVPGESVLLGDAGAIPFVSNLPSLDALGLGGYHAMPFARAAVNGEAATLELIERLTPSERPTHLALYPNWFGVITSRFGVELERVTLADNLICAGPTKVIYRADWSALDVPRPRGPDILDELDVADVISEREHAYSAPFPNGGWSTHEILDDATGARRFDGGRIVPEGASESFVVQGSLPPGGRVRVVVRTDGLAPRLRLRTALGVTELTLGEGRAGSWRHASAEIAAPAVGEVVTLEASSGAYRNYHVWLTR